MGIANFVFFILACISAQNTNTTTVYDACGSSLRSTVIADIVFNSTFWIIAGIGFAIVICNNVSQPGQIFAIGLVSFIYAASSLCLGTLSFLYSEHARFNTDCINALSDQTGGSGSPSANTGSPLLMIIGYVYGSIYIVASCIFFIVACCNCGLAAAHN